MADQPVSGTGKLGNSGNFLGHAYGERIHNRAAVPKTSTQSHNGQSYNGVISHGNGNSYEYRDEGKHFFKYGDTGRSGSDKGNKNRNDNDSGISL